MARIEHTWVDDETKDDVVKAEGEKPKGPFAEGGKDLKGWIEEELKGPFANTLSPPSLSPQCTGSLPECPRIVYPDRARALAAAWLRRMDARGCWFEADKKEFF